MLREFIVLSDIKPFGVHFAFLKALSVVHIYLKRYLYTPLRGLFKQVHLLFSWDPSFWGPFYLGLW